MPGMGQTPFVNAPNDSPDLVRTAARNNAELCDLVCSSHDLGGTFGPDTWTSAQRTPDLYPDAVTLEPDVDARTVLERIDDSPGASIKDSFATLDLREFGFEVLFDAEWISRPPAIGNDRPELETQWSTIDDAPGLAAWEAAWSVDGVSRGRFPSRLLDSPDIDFLCGRVGDDVVAGAIANRSRAAVGISNVFFLTGAPASGWAGLTGEIDTRFPTLPTVGYEPGGLLGGARRAGFRPLAPLRVWTKD